LSGKYTKARFADVINGDLKIAYISRFPNRLISKFSLLGRIPPVAGRALRYKYATAAPFCALSAAIPYAAARSFSNTRIYWKDTIDRQVDKVKICK
jgi:hypothetical protein